MTYILIPGAGGSAWYWSRLVIELERRGQITIAMDLPAGDDAAGLAEYADVVVDAVNGRPHPNPVIVVGQSLGGFTAPLVCDRLGAALLVLLNAMVPLPGESPGDWWAATGHSAARADYAARIGLPADQGFDPFVDFFHDVPTDVVSEAMAMGEPAQSDAPFAKPWPLEHWPDVPTKFLQGRDDRFFPLTFQRRVVRDRLGSLGVEIDELPGGHLLALSQPVALADGLERYRRELPG